MHSVQQKFFDNYCQHCGEDLNEPIKKKRGRPASTLIEKQLSTREKAVRLKVKNEYEQKISVLKDEVNEYKQRYDALREENKQLLRKLRNLNTLKEDGELRIEQELFRREEAIRKEITTRFETQYSLKEKELTKKIDDTKKTVATLDAQVNERSSRLMGEALELTLHEQLVNLFPKDTIEEIKVGTRGADVKQVVRDNKGKVCGTIMWEAKNAKWQTAWVNKLKSDIEDTSADIGIIVGTKLYQEQDFISLDNNLFATSPFGVEAVASIARTGLILSNQAKNITTKTQNNIEEAIKYFAGKTFEKRLNDFVASAKKQRDLVDSERAFFQKKWAGQEIDISAHMALVSEFTGELAALLGVEIPSDSPVVATELSGEE